MEKITRTITTTNVMFIAKVDGEKQYVDMKFTGKIEDEDILVKMAKKELKKSNIENVKIGLVDEVSYTEKKYSMDLEKFIQMADEVEG